MIPALVAAGVAAGATALSGYMGAKAQRDAANKMAKASNEERALYKQMYDEAYGDGSFNAQIQKLGLNAENQYNDLINDETKWNRYLTGDKAFVTPDPFSFTAEDLYSDPSYNFRKQQGLDAAQQSQVANGMNLSGAALKELNDYASDVASKEYQSAYGRAYKEYTDSKNFDWNKWAADSAAYTNNLVQQATGLHNVASDGITANTNQSNALAAFADKNASGIQQQATASGLASQANTQAKTSVLDALAKGFSNGMGIYGSTLGDNYTSSSSPTNTTPVNPTPYTQTPYTLEQGLQSPNSNDYATNFLAGWNPAISTMPTTDNLLGA